MYIIVDSLRIIFVAPIPIIWECVVKKKKRVERGFFDISESWEDFSRSLNEKEKFWLMELF